MRRLVFTLLVLGLAGGIVVGCEEPASQGQDPPAQLPANLIVSVAPAGAVDIAAARKSAKDGDHIVIKGRVGGQKEPLAANRAIMTISDLSLPTCDRIPGDTCQTPWDSCCEPNEEIVAKTVSVQVLGTDGRPIKASLSGVGGIAPGKGVVIAGMVRNAAESSTLIVEAKQIYVVP